VSGAVREREGGEKGEKEERAESREQRGSEDGDGSNRRVWRGEATAHLWARDANQPRLGAQGRVGDRLDIAGRSRRRGCLLFPSFLLLLARVVSARTRAVGSAQSAPVAAGVRLDDARRHAPRLE